MLTKRPLIGITANYSADEEVGLNTKLGMRGQEWQLLADDYITAIENSGGIPIILPITEGISSSIDLLDVLDGILFTGGSDIGPQNYGEDTGYGLKIIDVKRDKYELSLVRHVIKNTNIPILGICRGMQLLTVATGGSLYQDIRLEKKDAFNHTALDIAKYHPVHKVNIKEGSLLYQIFNLSEMGVNSFHHQAVKELGEKFEATIVSTDGMIEGIELKSERFICAVQWHPEAMINYDTNATKIFSSFIEECEKQRFKNYYIY